MYNIKISVIIPVYNVEKYLRQCLDSIINQTLKEIEIICVNDGSTDSSQQILEEYALKDERIKLINQKNIGAGASRKIGLDNAKGDLIAFVDSDDWVELDAFNILYKNAISNNSDVVITNFKLFNENNNKYDNWHGLIIEDYFDGNIDFFNFNFHYTDIKPLLLNGYTGCTKIYRTEFLRSYNDFYFPKYISLGEDVPFHVQVLLRASRISFCKQKLYIYRISNNNSSSNTSIKSEKVFEIFQIIDKVEIILIENKIINEFRYEFFIFQIVHLYHWFEKCDERLKNEFFSLIKKYFMNIDLKNDEINRLDSYTKERYLNIINSDSYREFQLLTKINLISKKNKYLKKSQKNLQKQLIVKEKIIKNIMSSKSWKMTKPLRKVGIMIKNLKR